MKFVSLKALFFSSVLVFLVGCQTTPHKTQYTLSTDLQSSVLSSSTTKPYSIIVTDVRSFGAGMSTDMLYTRHANVIEAYTRSAWVEPPIALIKTSIANGLIASNGFRDVLMSPTAITSPYKVETTIQKMLQTFDNGQSFVELNLMVRLVGASSQNLIYSKAYSAKELSSALDAAGGVEAYDRALKRLVPDIVRDINRFQK